ncbi:hypothetical protein N7516_002609 [Penicillium verrucosum]|uniref:uncharacterized protein n=1 Tax=Penicillium verrucosum TaxID=60171 RepID=UPI0025459DAE|nr:uncharacterized protein N7516_002609 [Penicillium verrucosum]KAJ5942441.1 hypothetical protein N7516_002609 [Penicillium verrucosum]
MRIRGAFQSRAGFAGPVKCVAWMHTAYGVGSPDAEYPTNVGGRSGEDTLSQTHERIFQCHLQSCNLIGILPRTPPQSVFERATIAPSQTHEHLSVLQHIYLVIEDSINLYNFGRQGKKPVANH